MQRFSYIFAVKDDKLKFHFIASSQFQTIEDERTWDCVKKPFQVIT